jgi:hypothetical protein
MQKINLFKTLGFFCILPSNIYALAILFIALIFNKGSSIGNKNKILLLLYPVAIILCMPGIYIGNEEGVQFAVRILVCSVVAFLLALMIPKKKNKIFDDFFYWVIIAAIFNGLFVILTALYPSLYDAFNIREISGFDREARFLRSPGFFRGFDTSGIFMIIGLIAMPVTSWVKTHGNLITTISILVLGVACAFSSRTSMLLACLALMAASLFYKNTEFRVYKVMAAVISILLGLVGFAFFLKLFQISFFIEGFDFFIEYILSDAEAIYSQDSSDYVANYSYSDVGLIPSSNAILPDSFFLRAGYAVGWIGMLGMMLPLVFLAIFGKMHSKGEMRVFFVLLSIVFFLGNFKNSYFYFVPFHAIYLMAFICSRETGRMSC